MKNPRFRPSLNMHILLRVMTASFDCIAIALKLTRSSNGLIKSALNPFSLNISASAKVLAPNSWNSPSINLHFSSDGSILRISSDIIYFRIIILSQSISHSLLKSSLNLEKLNPANLEAIAISANSCKKSSEIRLLGW